VLKLDRHDTSSRRRLDVAAREAISRTPPAAAVAAMVQPAGAATPAVAGAGAVPPPPPAAPGGGAAGIAITAGSVRGMSRDDRIKTALEARRKIIESRQQGNP